MASTRLYDIALTQFCQEAEQLYPDSKNQILLEEFLNERSDPREAQTAAKELQGNATEKYGGEHSMIPPSWVNNIIGNIGRIIDFGNFAMQGAPGPEGLAWTAVKIVLGAVQSNYALYTLFGTGLTDVCEVMLLVTHYDRLNEEGTQPGWRPSEIVQKLFEIIVRTYVAIFAFSFSIRRHITSGFKARLRHAFQDCFGIERAKFQGRLDEIAALKQRILESSEAVFQDKTLQQFQRIYGAIESTVKGIRNFEAGLADIAKAQEAQKEFLMRGIQDIKSLTTSHSPWGKAKKTFDKYTGYLKLLEQTTNLLTTTLEKRHEGTCEWFLNDSVYISWGQSTENNMLCLCGQAGSGKSVVLACIYDRLAHSHAERIWKSHRYHQKVEEACHYRTGCLNLLQGSDQESLFEDLGRLLDSETQWQCRIIVGCRINLPNDDGYTPLHVLLVYRRQTPLTLLKAFVDNGANVNIGDKESGRPFQLASLWGMAAIGGYAECIRFLAKCHADVNRKNNRERTALHHAAAGCFLDCVKFLLDWPGIRINSCDKNKRTPLFLACSGFSPETACLILDRLVELNIPVAEINQPSSRNRTPLGQSCARAFDKIVVKLVQYAKTRDEMNSLLVNEVDAKTGLTPLHNAASRGAVVCVRELLAINADVVIRDKKGRTPLGIAYRYWTRRSEDSEYEETISLLINKDPEGAISDDGLVAMCAAHGSIRLLQQLHSLNADLSKPDRYGWTPLDLARKNRHSSVEKFLKRQAAWAGSLPSRWVSQDAKVLISGNGLHINHNEASTHDGPFSISTEKPLPAGLDVYYFEVTIKKLGGSVESPRMAIGFCTLDGAELKYPGWYVRNAPSAVSWGYHSDNGSLRHSANFDADAERNDIWRYGRGDTIGCGVDYNKEEIWFTRNGKKLEYVFSNVKGRLFPVLGLIDAIELDTKFAGEFLYQYEETKEESSVGGNSEST
ncbi:ankyrin repeat-containing domain protein [Xylaria curta]|nr:ankyrin repeat-containing domain protein [Xylaria curta]